MNEDREEITLENLKEGAAIEMFNIALEKVMQNIGDINTTLKPMEINLKVTMTPNEDRTLIGIAITCGTKLCGQEAQKVQVFHTLTGLVDFIKFRKFEFSELFFSIYCHIVNDLSRTLNDSGNRCNTCMRIVRGLVI
jgi:hypothetical protein